VHAGFSLLTLLPGKVGGSETYVRGLLGAFGDGDGPERVTVLASEEVRRAYAGFAGGAVRVRDVPRWRYPEHAPLRALCIGAGLAAGRLLAPSATADLDLVHHPLTVPIPRAGACAATVVTYHDAQHLEHPRFFSRAERSYRAVAYDRAARVASVVVTPSEFTRRAAIDRLGLAPERVLASSHGIDHARFGPNGHEDDRLLDGLDLPERYVVYPANLWPHKNHERLVEALGLGADRELGLVLTGGLHQRRDALAAAAARAGVGSRVRHLGFVAPDTMPAVYRRATAMVFPSLYEGFGSPPLEAMACGCPTLVARIGALPEVCGPATEYFDPVSRESIAEALNRVTGDAALREQLREAGLARASEFTWRASARRHVDAYAAAIARTGGVTADSR